MGANSRWVDSKVAAKASIAALGSLTITPTAGSLPTADGAVTVANTATPTVVELLAICVELNTLVAALTAALQNESVDG